MNKKILRNTAEIQAISTYLFARKIASPVIIDVRLARDTGTLMSLKSLVVIVICLGM